MSDDIKEIYNIYGDELIKLNLNLNNTTSTDKKIIDEVLLKDKDYWNNFKFKELPKRLRLLMDNIRDYSLKPSELNVNIKSSSLGENIFSADSLFNYKKFYMSPMVFYYFVKPNSILFKVNYSAYNNRFNLPNKAKTQEDEVSIGLEYGHNTNKTSFFIQNHTFLNNNFDLLGKLKSSKSEQDIKRKESSNVAKITLSKNFNERPFIFRENFQLDSLNRLNLQFSHKVIKNFIDEQNCSPELISNIPEEDSVFRLKLSYLNSVVNHSENNVSCFKVGTSLINSLNSLYLRNRLFYRKLFFTSAFKYQFNVDMGNVMNLKGNTNDLKIHERLFVHNFSGIFNPSRKIVINEGKKLD